MTPDKPTDVEQAKDASREAYYEWWVENSPTDHSQHVVHGTRGSIDALRLLLSECERLTREKKVKR
jgi:hypothetical protein